MRQSRRWFLRSLGAGAAFLALPEVSPLVELISFPGGGRRGLDPTIESLLLGREPGGPFVAFAETFVTEGTAARLMNAPEALLAMIERQGVDGRFSGRPDLSDASGCKGNYERKVDDWQGRGLPFYTKAARPAANRDSSLMGAGEIDSSGHLVRAEAATQYKAHPAVGLSGNDIGALLVGRALLDEHYRLSPGEAVQSLTAIERRPVTVNEGQSATRYETPVNAVIHVPRPLRNSRLPRGRRSKGVVFAHNKNDRANPNQIYYAEVFV
jgi:hypothetical protein